MKSGDGIKRIKSQYGEKKVNGITSKESKHRVQSGGWPRGFCGEGVGVNSILCIEYCVTIGVTQDVQS